MLRWQQNLASVFFPSYSLQIITPKFICLISLGSQQKLILFKNIKFDFTFKYDARLKFIDVFLAVWNNPGFCPDGDDARCDGTEAENTTVRSCDTFGSSGRFGSFEYGADWQCPYLYRCCGGQCLRAVPPEKGTKRSH